MSEDIIKFLKDHPLISVMGIEKAAGVPEKTITKTMSGGRSIPPKHYDKIINVLIDYGFKKL